MKNQTDGNDNKKNQIIDDEYTIYEIDAECAQEKKTQKD